MHLAGRGDWRTRATELYTTRPRADVGGPRADADGPRRGGRHRRSLRRRRRQLSRYRRRRRRRRVCGGSLHRAAGARRGARIVRRDESRGSVRRSEGRRPNRPAGVGWVQTVRRGLGVRRPARLGVGRLEGCGGAGGLAAGCGRARCSTSSLGGNNNKQRNNYDDAYM